MKNYSLDPEYWQTTRNKQIAEDYKVSQSTICRERKKLIFEHGEEYKCMVKGWYDWDNVDWDLSNEEILSGWKGSKVPNIITIASWRRRLN